MSRHASGFISFAFLVCFGFLFGLFSFMVFELIYSEQKFVFIDEIFHVPQAQLYCKNHFTEWNPKITTLPGLYIVSYVLLKPFENVLHGDFCSVYALRFTNLLASVLNFFLAYKISCLLEAKYKGKSRNFLKVLTALNVAIFPPLYFFTFLYYTEVWSTTFVFLLYCLHLLEGRFFKFLGFFAACAAVLMRQTNIIWVGLMVIDDAWTVLSKSVKTHSVQDYKYTKKVFQKIFSKYFSFKNFWSLCSLTCDILSRSFHNIVTCMFFIGFVIVNKGIVLGDKEAHTATFHPMQNLYFLQFASFFGWPFFISEVALLRKKPLNIFLVIFLIGLCAGLSEANKLEHPYLLSDNRHLAFYLWKRIFGHPVFRRLIIPTYVGAAIVLFRLLQKRCHFMFAVMLSLCTILNLTPQYLFELRYFIVPFLMYRFQFQQSPAIVLETAFFIAVNAWVIHLFLNRPFVWFSEPHVKQRFIW